MTAKLMGIYMLLLLLAFDAGAAWGSDLPGARFLEANHRAVEQLLTSVQPGYALSKAQPVIVATVVGLDDLGGSRLGRLLAEQIGTGMTRAGYRVAELKLRGKALVRQGEGELMLSREVRDLSSSQRAQAVLVGTYTETFGGFYDQSGGCVYVTLKLIGLSDNLVIAAHDYVLPMDGNVRALLRDGRQARY